jgi:hypothetical protein
MLIEATRSFKMVVSCHVTMWYHNPEDHDLNLHCHENPKFHMRDKNVSFNQVTDWVCRVECLFQSLSYFNINLTFVMVHPIFTHETLVTGSWRYKLCACSIKLTHSMEHFFKADTCSPSH